MEKRKITTIMGEAVEVIDLISPDGETTQVEIVRATEKAILVKGNASSAWFPKAGIDAEGRIAPWVQLSISHCFLWEAPRR